MTISRCGKSPFLFVADPCDRLAHGAHWRRQRGISLIESLVALLLISIALLGVAGLQLTTLQDARDARWRIEAVALASGALELMRASRDNADAFEITSGEGPSIAACGDTDTAAICDSMMAWLDEVARLPNALAAITVDTVGDLKHVTLSLRWRQQPPVKSEDEGKSDPLPQCGADAASGGCVMLETRL